MLLGALVSSCDRRGQVSFSGLHIYISPPQRLPSSLTDFRNFKVIPNSLNSWLSLSQATTQKMAPDVFVTQAQGRL